jgi:hypothetical protein
VDIHSLAKFLIRQIQDCLDVGATSERLAALHQDEGFHRDLLFRPASTRR